MDVQKICFITCVNNERYYQECRLYLESLQMPAGFSAEYLAVRGAASMASGYNQAMRQSDAKYKIYLHQDVFVLKKDIVQTLLRLFQSDAKTGAVGLCGCGKIPAEALWWRSPDACGKVFQSLSPEQVKESVFGSFDADSVRAQAVDGFFFATQYDLPWREELFTGWHFYDLSQSLEFQARGYHVRVPRQETPWCLHFCGDKALDDAYARYRKIFLQAYGNVLR